MIRTVSLLCMAATLSGCASLTYPLPKCDGYSRRPLNRSMWQWEDKSDLKQQRSEAPSSVPSRLASAYIEERKDPAAFAHFDIAASYRRCED
jgi:type IV secretion system protein VirB7